MIGYLVNTYPRPSHSFIRREIQAIERAGARVHRFAMRPPTEQLVDAADAAEAAQTEYVLKQGAPRLVLSALAEFVRNPINFFEALQLAVGAGRRSRVGLARHLVYLLEASALARRCRALGIEHLHVHFGTNSATVAMLCDALGGPSWSLTVHGPEEFDAPEALSLPEKVRRAAFTVAVSAFGRSQVCRWAPSQDWPRIHVVHCGIDTAHFAAIAPLPKGSARLVSIGRFAEQKGQLLLVEAFARAVAIHPDLHLTLVGDGPLRPEIEASICAYGLAERVTLTGWVGEAGVRAELDAAHALVMPSFAEGLPVAIMEAMSAGRASLSTYIAGIPELVQHGETGWLVPAGDPAALAQAICAIAETPRATLEAYGRAGRERAFRRHDIDREARKLMGLFADVTRRPRVATVTRTAGTVNLPRPGAEAGALVLPKSGIL